MTVERVSQPFVAVLVGARRESTLELLETAQPGTRQQELQKTRNQVDQAYATVVAESDPGLLEWIFPVPEAVQQRMADLDRLHAELPAMRKRVDAREVSAQEIYDFYNRYVNSGTTLFGTQADTVDDREPATGGRVATEWFDNSDRLAKAASKVSLGLATGQLSLPDYLEFQNQSRTAHQNLDALLQRSTPEVRDRYNALTRTSSWQQLMTYEEQVRERGPWSGTSRNALPTFEEWLTTSDEVTQELKDIAVQQSKWASGLGSDNGTSTAVWTVTSFILYLVLILTAAWVVYRTVKEAQRAAEEADAEAARADEEAQRAASQAQLVTDMQDGFTRVIKAFSTEGVTNVTKLRGKTNEFMRSHQSDVGLTQQMFPVDELAYQIGQIFEDMAILSGGSPPRTFTRPQLVDRVIENARAGVSKRDLVKVDDEIPEVRLVPEVVDPVKRILSKLLDNATAYNPERPTTVRVYRTQGALVIDIEDRGPGMDGELLAKNNEILANPPEFNFHARRAITHRGLFIAGRSAKPHGIQVVLGHASGRGLRATIELRPEHVLSDAESTAPSSKAPSSTRSTSGEERRTAAQGDSASNAGPLPTRISGHVPTPESGLAQPNGQVTPVGSGKHNAPARRALPKRQPQANWQEPTELPPVIAAPPEPTRQSSKPSSTDQIQAWMTAASGTVRDRDSVDGRDHL